MKAYQEPANEKEVLFTKLQEAKRKDVERAFGVLQAKWHVLARPSRLWSEKSMADIVRCCIILHNMVVEHRRGYQTAEQESINAQGNVNFRDASEDEQNSEASLPTPSAEEILVNTSGTIANLTRCMRDITCEAEHLKLRRDLVEHIWSNFRDKRT